MDDKKPNITLLSAFIIAASIIAGAVIISAGTENAFQTCMKEARALSGYVKEPFDACAPN